MTRRRIKRLLKGACIFVGVGIVIFSPFFLLPDLSSQSKDKTKLAPPKQFKESQQLTTSKQQTRLQTKNPITLPKVGEDLEEDLAPDDFFPPQVSRYEVCANTRKAEKLQFHEFQQGSVVYSAFLDYRFREQSFIRMISILPSYDESTQMYCHFMDSRTHEFFTSVVEIEEFGTNEGYSFQGFLSSCDIPEEIDSYILCSVNISTVPEAYLQTDKNTKEIPIHAMDHTVNMETYGLCVPPITGEISVTQLVEFIELSQILGVSHVTFYDSRVSDKSRGVLGYYRERGLVSVYPWDLPHYISSNIRGRGQSTALNDCLYRNMDRFTYIAFNHLDEFIVPLKEKLTFKILESVKDEDVAGYCFQGFSFDKSKAMVKNLKTQLYTQRFTSRTKAPIGELSRCVASPKKVISLDLNTVSNMAKDFYITRHMELGLGNMFYYGKCNNREWDCGDSHEDRTMEKYREELEIKFNATMSYLRHYGLA